MHHLEHHEDRMIQLLQSVDINDTTLIVNRVTVLYVDICIFNTATSKSMKERLTMLRNAIKAGNLPRLKVVRIKYLEEG